jgi:hypothetical protein
VRRKLEILRIMSIIALTVWRYCLYITYAVYAYLCQSNETSSWKVAFMSVFIFCPIAER